MKVAFDGDVATSLGENIAGYDLPASLAAVPLHRLRLQNGKVIDAASRSRFFIDENGTKHVVAGRKTWPSLSMSFDEPVVRGADGKWRTANAGERLAPKIKAECSRRIVAVIDDATQRNLIAHGTALTRKEAAKKIAAKDKTTLDLLEAGQQWVRDMQTACRDMIAAADADYAQDDKWPPVPDGFVDLANSF